MFLLTVFCGKNELTVISIVIIAIRILEKMMIMITFNEAYTGRSKMNWVFLKLNDSY